jgi:hypothetical protein
MFGPTTVVGAVLLAAGTLAAPSRSLSGSWFFGADRPEPQEAVLVVASRCWNADVAVRLTDTDGKLTGTITWLPAAQGVPPSHHRDEHERLVGTRVGDRVRLTGEHRITETTYAPAGQPSTIVTRVHDDLRLDRKTGHLVGTREGQPFWLAPIKVRPTPCGAPPP